MVKNYLKISLKVENTFLIPELLIKGALIKLGLDEDLITREITDLHYDVWYLDEEHYQIELYLSDSDQITIGYLLDEDYEIKEMVLDIHTKGESLINSLNYEIINYEVNVEMDYKAKHLLNFLDGVYLDETIAFVGHNAKAMYGYKMETPAYKMLAKDLANKFEEFILEEGMTHFVFGTTLGGDIAGFFSAQFLKRKYPNLKVVLLLPYKKVAEKWYGEHKERFDRMLNLADIVIETDLLLSNTRKLNFQERIKPKGEYEPHKLFHQLDFLVETSNKVLIHDNTLQYERREHYVIRQAEYKNVPVIYI